MQQGQTMLGITIIVAAKLLGTALVGRLFILVEPQLMQFAWFARCVGWWRETRGRVLDAFATIVGLARRPTVASCLARGVAPPCHALPLTPLAPRIFLPQALVPDSVVTLPAQASRHVQVLRLQPGESVLLFNGSDGAEWPGEIVRIGRSAVDVRVGGALPVERELPFAATLAIGAPANDRMDALVEKAGELGAHAIQPLLCERSVLRLAGERAEARRRHWSGVAAAASEQCGRSRVTEVQPLRPLGWRIARRGAIGASRRPQPGTHGARSRAGVRDDGSRRGRGHA